MKTCETLLARTYLFTIDVLLRFLQPYNDNTLPRREFEDEDGNKLNEPWSGIEIIIAIIVIGSCVRGCLKVICE